MVEILDRFAIHNSPSVSERDNFVRYSDYAAMEQEVKRLRKFLRIIEVATSSGHPNLAVNRELAEIARIALGENHE